MNLEALLGDEGRYFLEGCFAKARICEEVPVGVQSALEKGCADALDRWRRGAHGAIVLAHCGTGKTYAARMWPRACTDVASMPYKYLSLPLTGESEKVKATNPGAPDPTYPANYLVALLCASMESRFALGAPDCFLAAMLESLQVPYALVYPEAGLKEEYERRFRERGNPQEFLDVFIGEWDRFMEMMDCMRPARRIRLASGQYLSDVLKVGD